MKFLKNSGKGLSPIKQIPVLSFFLLVIKLFLSAISLTLVFSNSPRGKRLFSNTSFLIECRK